MNFHRRQRAKFAGEFLVLAGVFQQQWLYGVVGAVESVGPGVTEVAPGDRVAYAMSRGS